MMDINQRKEQFSAAYLRAVAAVAGYTLAKTDVDDDSVDYLIAARGHADTPRRPRLELQLKCTTRRDMLREDTIHYPLKRKNYDDLRCEELLIPCILVVVIVPEALNAWLQQSEEELVLRHCGYWASLRGMAAKDNQTTITVSIPRQQLLSPAELQSLLQRIDRGELP